MPGTKDSFGTIIKGGFALCFKNILYIIAYWIIATVIFYILITPLSATVCEISGASDISKDAGSNIYIKTYFLTDLLPRLSARAGTVMNPVLLVGGFLLAFGVGIFFTGGLLDGFKSSLSTISTMRFNYKELKVPRAGDFTLNGLKNFPVLLMFFILGVIAFLLLNTLTASAGRFLKTIAWGVTGSEAVEYYTGSAIRIVYYILFLCLAIFLQYARIATVFLKEHPKRIRLRSVIQFKDGLWGAYDFFSENRFKAGCLFLIIFAGTVAWFIIEHLIYFGIQETSAFNPLIWSALSGILYVFFRYVQYAVAAVFYYLHTER